VLHRDSVLPTQQQPDVDEQQDRLPDPQHNSAFSLVDWQQSAPLSHRAAKLIPTDCALTITAVSSASRERIVRYRDIRISYVASASPALIIAA